MTASLTALLLSTAKLFTTPLSLEEMRNKQAVIETTRGTFIIELLPEAAPNHVGHFIKTAEEGGYDGTTFHRAVKYGIIQGGDPLTKDPEAQDRYGTGGLGVLARELSSIILDVLARADDRVVDDPPVRLPLTSL